MIKVINVISDTNIAGAGKCLINFCRKYDKKKIELIVIIPTGSALKKELEKTKVKIIEINGLKDKSWDIKALFKLIQILRKEKPNIVHTHASSTARLAAKFVKNCKIIYTRHSVFEVSPRIQKGIGRWCYRTINEALSDRIIAVAEAAKKNLTDGGINPEKIEGVLNGVEKVKEISAKQKADLKEKWHILEDEFVVGIIARLEEVKGHEYLIEAARILTEEKKIPAKFLILGTGSMEEALKEKVSSLHLEDKIIFTGFVDNVQDYLNILDVQVNCSYGTEATSLALLEGMSIGVPAVVSNYGGNPNVIIEGENGYVVPMKSSNDVADAIEKILLNEDIKTKMKKRALEIYEEKFTVEKFAKNIERIYEEVESEPKMKKFNLLDIVIILALLLIGIVGYKVLKVDNTVLNDNRNKVVYEVLETRTIKEIYDMIEIGTPIYDGSKNFYIGTVIDKKMEPTYIYQPSTENGEYVLSELEDKIDLTLKIESNAEVTDQNIMVGEFKIKVGNPANIRGRGYAIHGYVVDIER